MQQRSVVVIGMGELGRVFAEGLGRLAARVIPVRRGEDFAAVAAVEAPELVLITVGENDLPGVLASLPEAWKGRVGLVQNELLPLDWERHGIEDPTVAAVWFEKKPGRLVHVLRPTVIAGPARALLAEALRAMDIDVRASETGRALTFELVAKNVYILTTNCAGLRTDGTVGELLARHRSLALAVAREVIAVQEALVGHSLDREGLLADFEAAVAADRDHGCRGRTAPARLSRLLAHAEAHGLLTPTLAGLAAHQAS